MRRARRGGQEALSKKRDRIPLRPRQTPLMRRDEAPVAKATPKDLFLLAMEWWLGGRRFDIGQLARKLGVSRATVFRWVGSRERLYGEVISSLFETALNHAKSTAKGEGAAFLADITRRLLGEILAHAPLRTFIQQDPEYAMRVLMSKSSTVEQRCARIVQQALEEGVRLGELKPQLALDHLAYLIVRIGESFLYRDAINGDPPDIEPAITAIRLLLTARDGGAA